MGTLKPDSIECDRVRKRIAVPVTYETYKMITRLSAESGKPASKIVSYLIDRGRRVMANRPDDTPRNWPPTPPAIDGYRIQAAMNPYSFLDLCDSADEEFESIRTTAAALTELGLSDYLADK